MEKMWIVKSCYPSHDCQYLRRRICWRFSTSWKLAPPRYPIELFFGQWTSFPGRLPPYSCHVGHLQSWCDPPHFLHSVHWCAGVYMGISGKWLSCFVPLKLGEVGMVLLSNMSTKISPSFSFTKPICFSIEVQYPSLNKGMFSSPIFRCLKMGVGEGVSPSLSIMLDRSAMTSREWLLD